jgi:hypothetical protein
LPTETLSSWRIYVLRFFLLHFPDCEYLRLDECWSNELERVWKEEVVTCSMFNDPEFVWRKEEHRGRPEDHVCPKRDSNRCHLQYKSGILSVTTLLEKLVFGQLVANIPRIFGTRRFVPVFTGSRRWTVLWDRLIQSAYLHSRYFWRRSL